MATNTRILACKIPWTEEPGRLQSMGFRRVGHDWVTSLSLFTFMHWRRKWQPTPVFLPGESHGQGSLVGCHLWGCTVGHDWSNLAAAATAAALIFLEGKYFFVSFRMNYPFSFLYQIPLPYSYFCTGSWSFFIFYRLPLFPRVFHPKPVILLFSKPAVWIS